MLFLLVHLWPRTGFVVCGCNDKDIAKAFPTVVGLRAPVTTLGAVRRKKTTLPKPEASAMRISLFILTLKETFLKDLQMHQNEQ